jgi:MoxR-like ATPase
LIFEMSTEPSSPMLLQPELLEPAVELTTRLREQLDRQLLGRSELHNLVLVAILSRGHLLLEGVPGVGKTALVKALAQLLHLDCKRVQFTPDLMPGDILGTHILQETAEGRREMVFRPGPVFAHLLLADEINRASPKRSSIASCSSWWCPRSKWTCSIASFPRGGMERRRRRPGA